MILHLLRLCNTMIIISLRFLNGKRGSIMKKSFGFTLAEVLITLGIIGVVVAMSIPALNAKIQKTELETAFKVTYSRLNEILKGIENDYGSIVSVAKDEDEFLMLLKSYSAGSSFCKKGQAAKICWPERWVSLNGTKISAPENMNILVMANGASININCFSATCTSKVELKENIGCVRLRVDTNGTKLPNRVGYDIFDFYITSDGLIPRGDSRTATTEDDPYGWGKASYLLRNGKIDY